MLECLSFNSSSPSSRNIPPLPPSIPQGNNSTEEEQTPATSPSPNISHEYDLAIEAPSYNEILAMVHAPPEILNIQENDNENESHEDVDEESHHRQILTQVLQPDSNSVRETLANAKPNSTLTRLVSSYFDHSETTSHLCLLLFRTVHRARQIDNPISDFLSVLPDDIAALSPPQCDTAYELFLQFDHHENPFTFPHFHNLRDSFSDLRHQIQVDRRKCHHRIRLFRHATAGCAVCFLATVSVVVVTAAMVATHAAVGFAAVVATGCIPLPKKGKRRELARLKQLEAAENGTFVVKDVDTIDSLVDRLRTAVEGDKAYVQFALERGRDRHPIQEVIKQLRKTLPVFDQLLKDLEQHIFFCFYAVNKARNALLKEISHHQTL